MVHSIEFAAVQVEVVAGLRQGNQILNQLREEIRIEDVELLMENTAEAIAYQNVPILSGQCYLHCPLGNIKHAFWTEPCS